MGKDLSDIINHLGEERNNYYRAIAPPVFQSSNFTFESVEQMRQSITDELNTPFYTRGCNPTVAILRKKLAALAGADDALVFSSGSAAMAAAVLSVLKAGDHLVCVENPYGWTNKLINLWLKRYGVSATMVDGRRAENYERAIQSNTRLFILESPNSITFELQDIDNIIGIAKNNNIATIIDNSYCTPLFQKPLEMGVDISVHTISKYFGGHSDVVAGVVLSSHKRIQQIFEGEYMTLGGVVSPHDASLVLRSLRTFPLRMRRIAESTEKVVASLADHPAIKKIYYPFLKSNPQYALARKQMKASPGLFSILLNTDSVNEVDRFCNNLKRFLLACSWGGYESLVFPIAALSESPNYKSGPHPFNLVRLYIGLEEPGVLLDDILEALDKLIEKK